MPVSNVVEYTNVPEAGGELSKYIIREQQNCRLRIFFLKALYTDVSLSQRGVVTSHVKPSTNCGGFEDEHACEFTCVAYQNLHTRCFLNVMGGKKWYN